MTASFVQSTRSRQTLRILFAVGLLLALGSAGPARAGTFTTFDVPGDGGGTYPGAINDAGTITGYYRDVQDGPNHGFLLTADGTITTFDPPGQITGEPIAINSSGVITSSYSDATDNFVHGFVRTVDGTITSFDPPGSEYTQVNAINSSGVIVGQWANTTDFAVIKFHGFVRATDGTFSTFPAIPNAINASGTTTGYFADILPGVNGTGCVGFVRAGHGNFATFGRQFNCFTPVAINPSGIITGWCQDYIDEFLEGFVRGADGTFTYFDGYNLPSGGTLWLEALAINPAGVVIGWYEDSNYVGHGFVRSVDGTLTRFDPPGGSATEPLGINSAGTITGSYYDANGNTHGFIYK